MSLYFSYGSNLNQADFDRFCTKTGRPLIDLRTRSPRRAVLKDYRLDFNYYSSLMGGGAGNLEACPGEHVEGVVFEMTDDDLITLDLKEKAPDFFYRTRVTITLRDGTPLDGVIAYVACEDKKTDYTPPTHDYLETIVNGAKSFNLSDEWIAGLEAISSSDPRFPE